MSPDNVPRRAVITQLTTFPPIDVWKRPRPDGSPRRHSSVDEILGLAASLSLNGQRQRSLSDSGGNNDKETVTTNGNASPEPRSRIWWSGGEIGRRNGVAIVMDKKMTSRVMKVDVVSERIIKVTVRMEGKIMDIIQVYAPQTGCTDDEKGEFEEDLERHVKEERTIIIGDFNAQV
ncbi:Mitogen-activated protein kinase kinase kinase kinase 1, partial [Homalodisca vitripennis]